MMTDADGLYDGDPTLGVDRRLSVDWLGLRSWLATLLSHDVSITRDLTLCSDLITDHKERNTEEEQRSESLESKSKYEAN